MAGIKSAADPARYPPDGGMAPRGGLAHNGAGLFGSTMRSTSTHVTGGSPSQLTPLPSSASPAEIAAAVREQAAALQATLEKARDAAGPAAECVRVMGQSAVDSLGAIAQLLQPDLVGAS